jgi:hypothetical protein
VGIECEKGVTAVAGMLKLFAVSTAFLFTAEVRKDCPDHSVVDLENRVRGWWYCSCNMWCPTNHFVLYQWVVGCRIIGEGINVSILLDHVSLQNLRFAQVVTQVFLDSFEGLGPGLFVKYRRDCGRLIVGF